MRPPRAVRILDAHVEHPPIAVEVLDLQTVLGLVARIRPHARADETALLQPAFRTVRVQARDDVEGACAERARDELVLPVLAQQLAGLLAAPPVVADLSDQVRA